jgi:type II secretory ATPase GspE/PulE/Tfp pilus assembly ATPase PilB-like protein
MVEMNSEIRDLAFNRAPASKLRAAAKATGMRTILEDGKIKILNGVTTPAELLRITQAEGVAAN